MFQTGLILNFCHYYFEFVSSLEIRISYLVVLIPVWFWLVQVRIWDLGGRVKASFGKESITQNNTEKAQRGIEKKKKPHGLLRIKYYFIILFKSSGFCRQSHMVNTTISFGVISYMIK
jgi:hypothetical protein